MKVYMSVPYGSYVLFFRIVSPSKTSPTSLDHRGWFSNHTIGGQSFFSHCHQFHPDSNIYLISDNYWSKSCRILRETYRPKHCTCHRTFVCVWLCVGRSDISFSVSCRRLVGFFKTSLCFCELDALPWRHLAKLESNHPILSYRGSKWSYVWAVAAEVPPKDSHFTPLKSFTHTNSAQQLRLFSWIKCIFWWQSHNVLGKWISNLKL